MRKLVFLSFTLLLGSIMFMLASCLNENTLQTDKELVLNSKEYFGNNASDLSLPQFYSNTKSNVDLGENIFPMWDDAITTTADGTTIVEIPLGPTGSFLATMVTVHDSHAHNHKATYSSFLVMEYANNSVIPQMYVATLIEQGSNATIRYTMSRTEFNGFIIKSKLDGEVLNVEHYLNGKGNTMQLAVTNINEVPTGYTFYGFKAAQLVETTATRSCPGSGWTFHCLYCGKLFEYGGGYEADDYLCEECFNQYFGTTICSECGEQYIDCKCRPVCNECGFFESSCICDPTNTEDDKNNPGEGICTDCGLPREECGGHPQDSCSICNLPINLCQGH